MTKKQLNKRISLICGAVGKGYKKRIEKEIILAEKKLKQMPDWKKCSERTKSEAILITRGYLTGAISGMKFALGKKGGVSHINPKGLN